MDKPELGGTKKHYNHNKTQKNKPKVLLIGKIYADWCGHCRMLNPEWNKLKYNIQKNGSHGYEIRYIEIEQSAEQAKVDKVNKIYLQNSATKLALQGGYPTIFKIVDGNIEYYGGPRKAEAMQKWFLHHKGGNHEANIVEEKIGGDEPKKEQSIWNLNMFGGKTRNKRKLKRYPKNKSSKNKT
jgi:thiol-disulfide isomerase/thioredoxin